MGPRMAALWEAGARSYCCRRHASGKDNAEASVRIMATVKWRRRASNSETRPLPTPRMVQRPSRPKPVHAGLYCLDRVRQADGMVLIFVGFDEDHQDVQPVAVGRSRTRTP
jgi:hypothetical protein